MTCAIVRLLVHQLRPAPNRPGHRTTLTHYPTDRHPVPASGSATGHPHPRHAGPRAPIATRRGRRQATGGDVTRPGGSAGVAARGSGAPEARALATLAGGRSRRRRRRLPRHPTEWGDRPAATSSGPRIYVQLTRSSLCGKKSITRVSPPRFRGAPPRGVRPAAAAAPALHGAKHGHGARRDNGRVGGPRRRKPGPEGVQGFLLAASALAPNHSAWEPASRSCAVPSAPKTVSTGVLPAALSILV